jgi:ribosomal protein S18 acetylase RimI-like enzyme
MAHILDNPVWNALTSHNHHLGTITDQYAYFDPAVSPFMALAIPDSFHLAQLYKTAPSRAHSILVSNTKLDPAPWKKIAIIDGYQMVYQGPQHRDLVNMEIEQLLETHIPQMLALTALTKPGPFVERTIDFGHYEGIFHTVHLTAMAGQRLHLNGYAEVSAVCTHPDHLGKGYARHLLLRQINRIQTNGETPFLHVKCDNERAIGLYESLGFKTRTKIYFHVLSR